MQANMRIPFYIKTRNIIQLLSGILLLHSCSTQQKIAKTVKRNLLNSTALANAHVGIHIYDASDDKVLYDYQGSKYFIPASNTKIFTCYEAMKHFGDSLPGIRYFSNDTAVFLLPTGDPSLLNRDYANNPVIDFLKKTSKKIYINTSNWKEEALGFGWAWDDYNDDYMAERSVLPVYGNIVEWTQLSQKKENPLSAEDTVDIYFISNPDNAWKANFNTDQVQKKFSVTRHRTENSFIINEGKEKQAKVDVPLFTENFQTILDLIKDSIHKNIQTAEKPLMANLKPQTIFSQPTDSILKTMMFRSDNFFAEQLLLMISNELLGYMNDKAVVDSLLHSDLKELPQQPRWVDGSGLSRYNLFSPQDFVFILKKMKEEFGMERIKTIFPSGGDGTLKNYFHELHGSIFAKTGSLSNQITLSGFLFTQKNKLLIFSVMINAHNSSAASIRKTIEPFISYLRNHF